LKYRGAYQVEVNENVICVAFKGMFNLDTSKRLCAKGEDIINGLDGAPFYLIINLEKYEGSTPEAHEEGNRHAMWLEKQNCQGKAIVINEQVMLHIIRNEQAFLSQSQINTKVFPTDADAQDWIESLKSNRSNQPT